MAVPFLSGDSGQGITRILQSALQAVDPRQAVRAHVSLSDNALQIGSKSYPLDGIERVFVIGAGKAGAPMAAALEEILGFQITGGIVNVKYGHTSPMAEWRVRFGGHEVAGGDAPHPEPFGTSCIAIVEAGHPVPDDAGLAGAERISGRSMPCASTAPSSRVVDWPGWRRRPRWPR
jgi:hydroxypyruvate reductase